MFIEDQELDNSMDSLSEKMCNKMSTKQAGSLYLCHKRENCRRMLAEVKNWNYDLTSKSFVNCAHSKV